MNRIELHYDIARSPDEVFNFMTDFNQLRRWRTMDDLRLQPEGSARVGTRLFSKVKGAGRPMEFVNEIIELDPTRRVFRDRCLEGTFLIQSQWNVVPYNGGSRLQWVTEFEPRGMMKLLTPVLGRVIKQGQVTDLEKLKRLLETGTV